MNRCPRCHARREAGSGPCPACLLAKDEAPLLGSRYRLDEEIGEGGMGVVFRAYDTRLQRIVAAKVAKGPLDAEVKARFLREAQTLAALRHPAIVSALDIGEEDGELFIIMDFVEGVPLSRWTVPSLAAAAQIGRDVCEALEHAHTRGVIHRDVKPENVLVGQDGRGRLTDFGIARLVEDTNRLTRDGRVAGTPRYMAPEALRGETPSPAHDLYSLGLVLKELIERAPDANPASSLALTVTAAASPDPNRRFASARDLAAALSIDRPSLLPSRGPDPADLWSPTLWLRPLAVLLALATASALWAFLLSVTPRVISRNDIGPLVMTQVQDLGNGMVVSTARFETGAWLTALLFVTIAGALFGVWLVLRGRIRAEATSETPAVGRWLFGLGLINVSLWALHVLIIGREGKGFLVRYMPIGGGLVEMVLLVLLWTVILESLLRHQNPLRNLWLWCGGILMVVPPSIELTHYIRSWQP